MSQSVLVVLVVVAGMLVPFSGLAGAEHGASKNAISAGFLLVDDTLLSGLGICQAGTSMGCDATAGTGGGGAAFFDVSHLNTDCGGGACTENSGDFGLSCLAANQCAVVGGFMVATIGNDRDDDGGVTNNDVIGDNDCTSGSDGLDCDLIDLGRGSAHNHGTIADFDDQAELGVAACAFPVDQACTVAGVLAADGGGGDPNALFCFAHDAYAIVDPTVTAHNFDDFVVFVGAGSSATGTRLPLPTVLTSAVGNVVVTLTQGSSSALSTGNTASLCDGTPPVSTDVFDSAVV